MPEEQFQRFLALVVEKLADRPRSMMDHIREWAVPFSLVVALIAGYARLQVKQENTEVAVAEIKGSYVSKDNFALALGSQTALLQGQNDKLSMMYDELVEIRKLSYPPSFTAWSSGTKLKAKKY